MSFGWVLLLVTATTYRLTRLVTTDSLPPAKWVRDRITGDEETDTRAWPWVPDWLATLVTCPWCASVWVAAGVTAAVDLTVGLPLPWLVWAAAASGAAWISHLEEYFVR